MSVSFEYDPCSEIIPRASKRFSSNEADPSPPASSISPETETSAEAEDARKEEKPKRERQRENDIGRAKADLEGYQKKIAPKLAELAMQREQKIKGAEANLAKYRETLPQAASKRLTQGGNAEWHFRLE